jgi:hypothetical protein
MNVKFFIDRSLQCHLYSLDCQINIFHVVRKQKQKRFDHSQINYILLFHYK